MINKVILLGNLGKDPDTRFTTTGKAVTRFSLATSNTWTSANGEKQQATEWHSVVVWGKQGEACGQYLEKGRQVYVEGALQTRKWTDQSGQERYTTEVVISRFKGELTMLDTRGGGDSGMAESSGGYRERAPAQRAPVGASRGGGPSWDAPKGGDLDDEIPF